MSQRSKKVGPDVGHIPRAISGHLYYFMKTEGGFVNWKVISAKSCASPIPIPASGLEIPLLLKFSCHGQVTFEK